MDSHIESQYPNLESFLVSPGVSQSSCYPMVWHSMALNLSLTISLMKHMVPDLGMATNFSCLNESM